MIDASAGYRKETRIERSEGTTAMTTADWTADADPADLAEQQVPVLDDEGTEPAVTGIGEVGEADPADVIEQAVVVGGDDDGYDRA